MSLRPDVRPAPPGLRAILDAPPVRRLLDVLNSEGAETRLVGGAVRNGLLARPVHEHDFATTLLPEEVTARARAAGLKVVPTGIEHGTVTVVIAGTGFEVTTLREDVDTDGRHARVRFGQDFARDAARRDFTINAFSLDRRGDVHDYVGGFADLAAARIRFIGDADTRVREDYLRSLRFFRFTAEYAEGDPDREGLRAVLRGRDGLARLSRERVASELFKLLAARRAVPIVAAASEAGILQILLALAPDPARLARLCSAAEAGEPPDAVLRLAALAVRVPEDVDTLRDRLRLSNETTRRLAAAAGAALPLHCAEAPPRPDRLRELLFRHGRATAQDALRLAASAAGRDGTTPEWSRALGFLRDTPEPHLPISGSDLQARGIAPGPALGRLLKALQAAWIRAGFPQDPQTVAALVEGVVARDAHEPSVHRTERS